MINRVRISKTDFIQYLDCPKSLWLLKHKPNHYPHGEFSGYMKKLTAEGYEVEAYVQDLLCSRPDGNTYAFQSIFQTSCGLYAKADVTRDNGDDTINLYEVKSSNSVKTSGKHNQIKDAAFQKIVAEKAGLCVAQVFIVHLNSDYVRQGAIDPEQLLVFSDVTHDVADAEVATKAEIERALALLSQQEIDESWCSCLKRTRGNHCDTFTYFNPAIPKPSIYDLPRVSKSKLSGFVADGRFGLDQIKQDEVTENQSLVLTSAHLKQPIIDPGAIADFFDQLLYPIYFFDYETYSSAIPLTDGARPQSPIPFQYSLHVKRTPDDTDFIHVGYLAETAAMPIEMITHMQDNIGTTGSLVSWHASFENTQNKMMAKLYPEKAAFLKNLVARTLDLEAVFKRGYVDIAFAGSTSIKNVLPVMVPELSYKGMAVANGTEAMESWIRLINMPDGDEKIKVRQDMLEYCKLDTKAMVRIFEAVKAL